jgi:alkanesulfonate monooxygenase SsuD/methylene tetrahydromethanopterin reductase-like flavin-dependent oxidoreductase (luciferase family)
MRAGSRVEVGLHFTLHLASQYSIPEVVRFASLARQLGFDRVWINDNFGYRHTLVALGAIAAGRAADGLPLGVAITHPYARNPLDAAAAFASLTELMPTPDLIVGLAIGDLYILGTTVDMLKPSRTVVEMARLLQQLWRGEPVRFTDFPNLSTLYRLRPERTFAMSFTPRRPIRLYCAGSARLVADALPYCDGIIIGGEFITLVQAGMLATHMGSIVESRGEGSSFKKMCEINVSVSRDRRAARDFAKKYVCHGISRQPDPVLERLGIDVERVQTVRTAFSRGGTVEQVAGLVTDDMVDAIFVAGTPDECVDRLRPYLDEATTHGFDHVLLAKLGPDYGEAINILGSGILPAIRAM